MTRAAPGGDEPEHILMIRADVSAGVALGERAEQLQRELAAVAAVPVEALRLDAIG